MRYIVWDRTRHENFEKCPRLRFITHEYPTMTDEIAAAAHGVDRNAVAVPLLSGGTVHKGIETFVRGSSEQDALDTAFAEYDEAIAERGVMPDDDSPDTTWTVAVQKLLCEALIRGWIRYVWPRLNAEYDVVDIEREERLEIPVDEETVMVLLTRTDLLMRRKLDGNHFVFNHKTINEPTDKKLKALRYDTQSISEVLAAQARYDAEYYGAQSPAMGHDFVNPIQIDGVIYDLLVKGPRKTEYPKGSGVWHNASPLIWCYQKEGQTGITEDELAARWEYVCPASHSLYRGQCPGGKNHTLGPKYHRKLITDVFETSPVLEWFQWLDEHEPARHGIPSLIEQQFVTLAPIMRTPFDVETWKRGVLTEEWGIADRADTARREIAEKGWRDALPTLDILFPKHTAHGNCLWPGQCPMFDACWGTPVDDLLELENNAGQPLLVPRKSNHPEGIPEA